MDKCGLRQYRTDRLPLIATILLSSLLPTAPAAAADSLAKLDSGDPLEPLIPNRIDRARDRVSTNVNDIARWLDSFFLDERFVEEEAYTRVRLAPGVFFEEGKAAKPKLSVSAKIRVPRFNEKLKLTISGDTDDRPDDSDELSSTNPARASENEADIGLEYTLRDKRRLNTSLSAGIKLGKEHGIDLYVGPRLRKTFDLDGWQTRFTERIRWYTDIGWESVTRLDFERALSPPLFFRGTLAGRWREEDPGYRYEIGPALFQPLRRRAVLEYQWNNLFETRPKHRLEEINLRLRYRQQKWRKWLFFEINPQLSFSNDDEFRPTPGIELRFEATFGGVDRQSAKRRIKPLEPSPELP